MRIYISGGITGIPDYKERFAKAEEKLKEEGNEVINPARVDDVFPGLNYEEYMKIDILLLSMCDAIYLLDGWDKSRGANREYGYALVSSMTIIKEQKEGTKDE